MTLSETCIRRPVLTTLITASIIVFGIFGYRLLAVAALPRVDFPTIQVTATLPGASPETMAASVAGPIERQFSTISGITSMTSQSSLGRSQITVQFDLNRDIDGAALDVQDPEPPDLSQPPYNDPRVIVTPHAAFVSEESLANLRSRVARQVATRLTGGVPECVVNGVA